MPDSYGKRQRDRVKARKAAAREERRLARQERDRNRAAARDAGEPEPESWLAEPDPDLWAAPPAQDEAGDEEASPPKA